MGLMSNIFGKKQPQQENILPPRNIGRGRNSFEVQDVFDIKGVGIVLVGRILSGTLMPGQMAVVNGKTSEIKSIEAHHQQLAFAPAGTNVGMCLKGINKADLQKGMILDFA